ncbi:MAG TPA: ABC transporter permease, partial [Candidatus Saccharimonadales bacterium]
MKMIDVVRRAGRSLRSAKARTLLTSLAIAVGAFTLTVTLAAGNGIRAYTDRLISSNFDPAELIVGRDPEVTNTGAPNSSPKAYDDSVANLSVGGDGSSLQVKQVTQPDIDKLKKYDFAEQVRPNYQVNARYVTSQTAPTRYTLSLQSYNVGQKPELAAGSLPTGDLVTGGLLLPDVYLEPLKLGTAEQAIGKNVTITVAKPFTQAALQNFIATNRGTAATTPPNEELRQVTYRITGITKRAATSISFGSQPVLLGSADTADLYAYTSEGTENYNEFTYVYVRVKGGQDEAAVIAAKDRLQRDGFYVMTSRDVQASIQTIVDVLQGLVAVFGIITIIASVFGIINTMYISVLERTREIGLMKALGMRSSAVAWLFRLEAAWIGLIGGSLGALSAYLLSLPLNP